MPQVLFILSVEEDAQQHALPLAEVTWRPHLADPTLIYIEKLQPEPKPQNPDMEVGTLLWQRHMVIWIAMETLYWHFLCMWAKLMVGEFLGAV